MYAIDLYKLCSAGTGFEVEGNTISTGKNKLKYNSMPIVMVILHRLIYVYSRHQGMEIDEKEMEINNIVFVSGSTIRNCL